MNENFHGKVFLFILLFQLAERSFAASGNFLRTVKVQNKKKLNAKIRRNF